MAKLRALGLAAALLAWSFVPGRHPLLQAPLAAVLIAVTKAPMGVRPPALWAGLRLGAAAGSVAAAAVTASATIPRVRAAMADRTPPASGLTWLALRIPVGTVWSEEAAYRGALATLAAAGFGPRVGRLLQATVFGLSHVADARATREPVAGTVVATGVAGWVFGWLAERSGSLAAPMLAHLAINEAGALAALAVRSSWARPPASRR
ncbi:MAG: CPBP family intramembrane metalloprotease [Mycobacteriaceae bacterium]|nr:CPBP family intramembrane metalloprotease [Mycobacteriaceae bacterium]